MTPERLAELQEKAATAGYEFHSGVVRELLAEVERLQARLDRLLAACEPLVGPVGRMEDDDERILMPWTLAESRAFVDAVREAKA